MDTQIQKMGCWQGTTFKEYIREELACFLEGMSTSMKKQFSFVNITGNAFNTITDGLIKREYEVNVLATSRNWTTEWNTEQMTQHNNC